VKKSGSNATIWQTSGRKFVRTLLSGLFLSGVVSIVSAQPANNTAIIEAYGEPYAIAQSAPSTQARVFVYRASQAVHGMPVNLYLNGQYHASLLRGGFTEFCANPGAIILKTALNDAERLHLSKHDAGQRLVVAAGQTLFLKVDENPTAVNGVVSGTKSQTQADLLQTRRQIHTISRAKVAVECDTAAGVAAKVPTAVATTNTVNVPSGEYNLEADALFEFGKSELRASSRNAIETLVQKIQQDFTSVERIRVIGYTDPIGSAALNQRLSQARANVVAKQIETRNLKIRHGIQAEGRGSIELAKTGCGNTPTPANKLCHAPNRRVMVVITGARR
jgi:OmpA-OmpF porin, OOP family